MTSWKNVVNQRKYRERGQLQQRQHLGFLEKKKDYKLRAANFHKKRDTINKLLQKKELKNEDEFYFRMEKSKLVDGKVVQEESDSEEEGFDEKEYSKILKTQNQSLVRLQRRKDAKEAKALQGSLQLLDQQPLNKHTFFVQNAQQLEEFDLQANRRHSTPITENNLNQVLQQNDPHFIQAVGEKMKRSYKKLADSLVNKSKMDGYFRKIEYEKNLLGKESRKIKKHKGGEYHRFFQERKR